MALQHGSRHWLVPFPGLFHAYWHCLESVIKLGWELGFATLAELLGRKKVRRDATKGVMEVHHDFLSVVVKGMWAAIMEEWGRHVADRLADMNTDEKVANLHAYMMMVCENKKFTHFWWTQVLTKYAFMYFEVRRAVRESDITMIECIMRKMLHLFKFTHKVKYVILTLFMSVDLLTLPFWIVVALRSNQCASLSGIPRRNVPVDVWVENTNLFHKKVAKEYARPKWVKAISIMVTPLQAITNRLLRRAHLEREKDHSHPKMEEDVLKVKEICLSLRMFQSDGEDLPLIDHFKRWGGSHVTEMPGRQELHSRYLDVERHTTPMVAKQATGIISVLKERELAILATGAKQEFLQTIGVDSPVNVGVHMSVNPALVYNWRSEPAIEVSSRGQDAAVLAKLKAFCGYTSIDAMDIVDQAFFSSVCTSFGQMASEEYIRVHVHKEQGLYMRDVDRCIGAHDKEDLMAETLEASYLLLGGVRVSITDDEAIELASLEWKSKMAVDEMHDQLMVQIGTMKHTLREKLAMIIAAAEDAVRWSRGIDGKLHARNWNKGEVRHHLSQCAQGWCDVDAIHELLQRMVSDGDVVVDSWTGKTSKL
ncbi:hypothetical protein CYMTET_22874 [Cymbomonas tetramitiformis]|uniref:DUF6589 domain-containing protein n=1 Tax=Cymbomonas tetramitiformis TaxID=36881 RepID=A0AAE0L1S0_9CHLO|nr:hypothetical protein CYMTET_22874 [Cymbomonas tetramitiformis]